MEIDIALGLFIGAALGWSIVTVGILLWEHVLPDLIDALCRPARVREVERFVSSLSAEEQERLAAGFRRLALASEGRAGRVDGLRRRAWSAPSWPRGKPFDTARLIQGTP